MDFRQLEAFILVADLGSFSKTAKQLRVTQPTISAYISALESELGCRLIDRLPGEARPTATGKRLYTYAAEIVALRGKALAACQRQGANMGGAVRLAASSIPAQYVLPVLMAGFRVKYPGVQFEVNGGNSETAAQCVLDGSAELALTGTLTRDRQLVFEPFMEDELVVIAPAKPPYSEDTSGTISLGQLIEAPFILRGEGSGTRRETEAYLARFGYETGALNVVATMDNPDAVIKGVSQGLGISIVSRLSAADYERFGLLRIFQLAEGDMRRILYVVQNKNRPLSAAGKAFVQYVTQGGTQA